MRGIGSHIVLQGFCSSQSFRWESRASLGWGVDVWTLTLQDSPLFCVAVSPPPPTLSSPASIATGIWICYYGLFLLETQRELAMALRLVGGL